MISVGDIKSGRYFFRIVFSYTDSNGQLSVTSDEIDKIRSEKNQGKIQIGQWCHEIDVGTAEETPALITTTNSNID